MPSYRQPDRASSPHRSQADEAQLSPSAASLLALVRSLGFDQAITVDDLHRRSDVDANSLDAALAELDDRGLIRVRGDIATRRCQIEVRHSHG